jgi:hypothetical protein
MTLQNTTGGNHLLYMPTEDPEQYSQKIEGEYITQNG